VLDRLLLHLLYVSRLMHMAIIDMVPGVFEPPSNLLLKRLRPSVWLPTIMVAWGIVMTCMGTVDNFAGLLTARLFLGVAEAGLFPGVAYFLSGS
jgi:hypothetical protein